MDAKPRQSQKSRRRLKMVVKIGSSSITDETGNLSQEKVSRLVHQVAAIQRTGAWQVVLVSSGAVAAGMGKLGWRRTNITMPEKQAAASVGQGLLMHTYEQLFRSHGMNIGQVLLTRSDVEDRSRFVHIRNTLHTLLRHNIVPVVNENDTVAVDEIRFGDNDTLASLVALVTEAHQLVLLTDIDGLYTANPMKDPSAEFISDVFEITREMEAYAGGSSSSVGTGGMRTKITAAKMAVTGGCDVVVASASVPNILLHAAEGFERKVVGTVSGSVGEQTPVKPEAGASSSPMGHVTGTRFHANTTPVSLRKAWLIHGSKSDGEVFIDAGAVRALTDGAASLLIPGVTGTAGEFREGATVDVVGPDGVRIGRGIVAFSAHDLELLLARRLAGERLHDLPEVVHRNDLAVFEGKATSRESDLRNSGN